MLIDKSSKHYISLVLWFESFVVFIAILYAKLSVPLMKSGIVGLILGSMSLWLWSFGVFIVILYAKLGVPPYEKRHCWACGYDPKHVTNLCDLTLANQITNSISLQVLWFVSFVMFIVFEERILYANLGINLLKSGIVGFLMGSMNLQLWS